MKAAREGRDRSEFRWLWVWLFVAASVAAGTAVTVIFWGGTRAEHRDAFESGWKSAAAILAILAALVTVERLRLGQREHSRQLAADQAKEITELSAKASEQLGSDKAAVRIGGLTDLERLAQSYPQLRQTVMDRVCAYLRAPFEPPLTRQEKESGSDRNKASAAKASDPSDDPDEQIMARRLELDVRRTAQRIIFRHLRPSSEDSYWPDIAIDLRDAALIDADFRECLLMRPDFEGAMFFGKTRFDKAQFKGRTSFTATEIKGRLSFSEVTVDGVIWFDDAKFGDFADFENLTVHGSAIFDRARFNGLVMFKDARIAGDYALFDDATFEGPAYFQHVAFLCDASFAHAKFGDYVTFQNSRITKMAVFPDVTFLANATFGMTTFESVANFQGARFMRRATFELAEFMGRADFDDTTFDGEETFENAKSGSENNVWPVKWEVQCGGKLRKVQ
jgi:uncharacterized protein YjbI with pentapeptide repeats